MYILKKSINAESHLQSIRRKRVILEDGVCKKFEPLSFCKVKIPFSSPVQAKKIETVHIFVSIIL